ncbi:MAG: sugar transferase [Nitrospira sp.]|nr:sugar transferase [Nitrospira sp.]
MLRERTPLFRKTLLILDLLLTVLSFLVAVIVVNGPLGESQAQSEISTGFSATLLVGITLVWTWLLLKHPQYGQFRGMQLMQILYPVVRAIAVGTLILGFWMVFVEMDRMGRSTILLTFAGVNLLLLVGLRLSIWLVLVGLRSHGYNYRNVLIVGTGSRAKAFAESVHQHPAWGLRIEGYVDWDYSLLGRQVNGSRVIGVLDTFAEVLDQHVIDEVVFFVPRRWLETIESAVRACESRGIRVRIGADLFQLSLAKAELGNFVGMPMVTYQTAYIGGSAWLLKRFVDIAIASLGLVACLPVFVMLGIMIKLTSPGPIFFSQQRVGLNGRLFWLYKFRSMEVNAEARQQEVAGLNQMSGPMFKAAKDPRITPIGRVIRKWSLDELPQFYNVLRGDMSLVGPRPSLPKEISQFEPWQKRRLSVRPGITGLWQVKGRNNIHNFEEWMKLDLQYIDNWSFGRDLKIVGQTLPAVLIGKGAS